MFVVALLGIAMWGSIFMLFMAGQRIIRDSEKILRDMKQDRIEYERSAKAAHDAYMARFRVPPATVAPSLRPAPREPLHTEGPHR